MSTSEGAIAEFKLRRQPTTLQTYMQLYEKAYPHGYTDYMLGASALAKYLSPIEIKPPPSAVPRMLRTYEIWKLAVAILPYTTNPIHTTYQQIEDAIYELSR